MCSRHARALLAAIGFSHQFHFLTCARIDSTLLADDPNNAAGAKTKSNTIIKKDGASLPEDTVELDEEIGDPQSADIIDQDPFGLLSTMEQLDIAEAGEPFIVQSSEVSTL